MTRVTKSAAICASLLMLAPLSPQTYAARKQKNLRAGAVYVLTNQHNNAVAAFRRNAKGILTPAGQFPTGGAGNPVARPPDPPVDPLASQGALIITSGNRFLIAVNAASNQISVLKIKKNSLQVTDLVSSGGIRPISLSLHDDLLYVLHDGPPPSITAFTFEDDDGTLTPVDLSVRPLLGGNAADPAQVGFNRDGDLLVVTEKMGNRLDTYAIDDDGLASGPFNNPSSGITPFGFAFTNSDTLVVSEAFAPAPGQAAASSYSVSNNNTLNLISGSVHNGQTAACWVVITKNGKLAFVSNTRSGTISSYRVNAENGSLTLLNPVAANTGANSSPRDMALSVNSRILFVQLNAGQAVGAFRIGGDGSLTLVDTVGGLPFGAQGIASK